MSCGVVPSVLNANSGEVAPIGMAEMLGGDTLASEIVRDWHTADARALVAEQECCVLTHTFALLISVFATLQKVKQHLFADSVRGTVTFVVHFVVDDVTTEVAEDLQVAPGFG